MRRLAPIRELPEQDLEGLGEVAFFGRPVIRDSVKAALEWLHERGAAVGCTAVLGGALPLESSVLSGAPFDLGPSFDWQAAVRQELVRLVRTWSDRVRFSELNATATLDQLSDQAIPTANDRGVVAALASELHAQMPAGVRGSARAERVSWRAIADAQRVPGVSEWRLHAGGRPEAVIEALRSGAWADTVEAPTQVTFAPQATATVGQIPVFSVGEIKGLERDCVLLVVQGDAPRLSHELFVGVSRARSVLVAVLEAHALSTLPPRLRSAVL